MINNAILMVKVFLAWYYRTFDRFRILLHGLSEDMEDFMLEQLEHYEHNHHKFYWSFYTTCVSMWTEGADLSEKQLSIIERGYNKVRADRIKDYCNDLKRRVKK